MADAELDHLVNPNPSDDHAPGDYQAGPAEALAAIYQRSGRILDFLAANIPIMLDEPSNLGDTEASATTTIRAAAEVAEEMALLGFAMLAAAAIMEQHPEIADPATPQTTADAAQHLQTAAFIARAYRHAALAISRARKPAA